MNITQILDACTGCGVCAAVCPSAAVKMQPDAHGFLRPVVDDAACTDCGLCTRKCPVSVLPQNSAHTDVLTGYAKDGALLPRSSSGAIFPVLAAEIIRKGGLVFGAAFDGQFQVVHTAAESVEELSALCSSKYVQGRIPSDCYAQVKAALVAGRWVYFSGMPCQVAALKSYLSRDYDTLITQDTACHSIPSPLVWEGYKAELEKQYGGKLTAFSFRNKANGWEAYHSDAEFMACHKQLLANGLTTDTPVDELATADEVSYTKEGSPLYIELHRHLFDSAEDAHDELNHFFTDINPVEIDGLLVMPPHEHLLYLILHAYKHFVRSGIGLRQFCDIGLWAWEYHDEIDWQRLHEQCESVHAATFAAAAFRIARDYLGIDFDLPTPWDASIDAEPLLHDTLCGGVYGSNDLTRLHSSTVTLNAVKASRTGEKSSVLSTVFPKREYLERRYPYLKKRPYLLPVAWVQRLVHYAGEKKTGADSSASGSIKLAKERIELMKRYGIMD